jgi:tRNA-dihydrouridine synthase A
VWSDHRLKTLAPREVAAQATAARLSGLALAA